MVPMAIAPHSGIVLRLVEKFRRDPPQLSGATLAACMRSAPIADIYYIDAFTIGAIDVRDDVPLLH